MCALIASPFKTRKPRQFEYRPRYYDPDKEAWEQRRKELFGEEEPSAPEDKENYRPGQYVEQLRFRRGIMAERQRSAQRRPALVRLVFLIALLVLLGWYMFS